MKRIVARGIIFINKKLIAIHRIKEKDGKCEEYYVFPGGGVEENETMEEAVIREIKEEIGIDVKAKKYLYKLDTENTVEHFFLCEYVNGDVGTGTGPEFTSKDRGVYIPELVDVNEVGDKLLPKMIFNTMKLDLESGRL